MNLDRIAALLAKAERTDNEAEAEAYLMKAQALATAASVDLAFARARTLRKEARQSPESRTRTIGEKGKRANVHLVSLFVAIAHVNDAHVDVASNSTFVIVYGMPGDLDAIEALYASVAVQMTSSAQTWLATGSWKGESYVSSTRTMGGLRRLRKPHTAQTARASFYRAYVERIGERLEQAKAEVVAEVASTVVEGAGTGALVLREKTAEVKAFHRRESDASGTWGGYSGGVRADKGAASQAGRAAASRARLGAQREIGGKGEIGS